MNPYKKLYTSNVLKEVYSENKEVQIEELKNSKQLASFKAYRAEMKDKPYQPAFHFYSPDGMINDPNGLSYWKGNYHLFYQAYPPEHPSQHWGHAVSKDMVNWQDLPLAIYPDIEKAVFSGSCLVENDRVIAMYHGLGIGNVIATSKDENLLNWEKQGDCPVIPMHGNDKGYPYRIFDPFLWKEDDGYYALSGTRYGDEDKLLNGYDNKMVEHLFYSKDLEKWIYLGELAKDGFPQVPLGNDGACPYFLPFGDRHILFFFSHQTGPYCIIGDYDKVIHKFTPDKLHKFNFGPNGVGSYQAPCAISDGKGGVYLVFNTKDANRKLKRQGAMSLMYHVKPRGEKDLYIKPVQTIENLHEEKIEISNLKLKAFEETNMNFAGNLLDIDFTFDPQKTNRIVIKVLCSENKEEYTDIIVNFSRFGKEKKISRNFVTIDTTYSSLSPDALGRIPETTEFIVEEKVNLRIIIDKCMIEVFANENKVIFQNVYPILKDSNQISITSIGNDCILEKGSIYKMKSIYPTEN